MKHTTHVSLFTACLALFSIASFSAYAFTSPAAVNLGTAGNYAILAETLISTTGTTSVVGDMAISPAAATFITGFGLIADPSNTFSTSSLVTGKVYAADYEPPTPSNLGTAIGDMGTAFADAAGRAPDVTELGAGDISGMTLAPGVYKWSSSVLVSTDVTLSGTANDIWIFEISGDLTLASGAHITLIGGAQPKNIYWQVDGPIGATLGTTAAFNGNILSSKQIIMNTGAVLNGRALAQTQVTLDANSITVPSSTSNTNGGTTEPSSSWPCNAWSACSSDGKRIKTCTQPGTSNTATQTESCTPSEPVTPPATQPTQPVVAPAPPPSAPQQNAPPTPAAPPVTPPATTPPATTPAASGTPSDMTNSTGSGIPTGWKVAGLIALAAIATVAVVLTVRANKK